MSIAYAHTLKGSFNRAAWEPLPTHLADVAALAGEFASAFGAGDWGKIAGEWHDLGKYSEAFQAYLASGDPDAGEEQSPGGKRVDHSTYGARHAYESAPAPAGQLLAFCLAGHHAGLADATTGDEAHKRSTLAFRLDGEKCDIEPVTLPPGVAAAPALRFPLHNAGRDHLGFTLAFFTRMIFSALIDADRTATEAFCDRDRAADRRRPRPTLAELRSAVDAFLEHKQSDAPKTAVNAVRARVLAECRRAADGPPGFYSLNVPTGGGKTFASLAFALRHAAANPKLRRVVVAIPGSVD